MASKKQIAQQRKKELTAQLAESRQSISISRHALKENLQVKKQLRQFVNRKPKAVFAGAVAAGLALTLLLKRPRRAKRERRSTSQMLLGWGFALVKPAAKAWLITRAKRLATDRVTHFASQKAAKPAARQIEHETLEAL